MQTKSNFKTLGSMLGGRLGSMGMRKGIEAGRAVEAYKKVTEEIAALEGTKMTSWDGKILIIGVDSSFQRQEVVLQKNKIILKMKALGFAVEEVRTNSLA